MIMINSLALIYLILPSLKYPTYSRFDLMLDNIDRIWQGNGCQ